VLYFNYCEASNFAYRKLYKTRDEAESSGKSGSHFYAPIVQTHRNELKAELHPYDKKNYLSFFTKISEDKKYIIGFSSHVEEKIESNKLYLLSQEHRFIAIAKNMYNAFKNKNRNEKWSAVKSLFFYFKPGSRVALIIGGGLLIGIPTISLMQKNNEYVASQNYQLQKQIFVQANSDRRLQLSSIIEYLYKTKASIKNEPDLEASIEPEFNRYIRVNALKQIVEIEGNPLEIPKHEENENISQLVSRVICENVSYLCENLSNTETESSIGIVELQKLFSFIHKKLCNESDHWYGKESYCGRMIEFKESKQYEFNDTVSELLSLKEMHCLVDHEDDLCAKINQAIQVNIDFKETVNIPEALLNGIVWPDTRNVVVNAERAYVKGTKFDSSILFASDFGEANFTGVELKLVDMRWSNLLGINFSNARIQGGDFNGSEMSYMILNNTEFVNVKMNFVTLQETDFRKVSTIKGCSFIGAKMAKSNMRGVDISRNDFKYVDLEDSNLMGTDLFDVRFENANLRNVSFNMANFKNVILKNADVKGADFSGAVNISCEQLKTAKNWEAAKFDLICV